MDTKNTGSDEDQLSSICWDPERGTIEEWIMRAREQNIPVGFKGPDAYQRLVELRYIAPWVTGVRLVNLMESSGDDELYMVADDFQLLGLDTERHAGHPGIHDPEELLARTDIARYDIDVNDLDLSTVKKTYDAQQGNSE